jgi:non-homologous end joining protein Ku
VKGYEISKGQYVRVTQEDGHQAWSSPIYLIG